jgi:protein SPT2
LQVKFYKSTFDPPKKEQKSKALSANIQKFLARKEEEERRKIIEAKKKKDVSFVVLLYCFVK